MRCVSALVLSMLLCSCTSSESNSNGTDCPVPTHPDGWETAVDVAIQQSADLGLTPPEAGQISVTAQAGRISIIDSVAYARCNAQLMAMVRQTGSTLDLLVEPKEMCPSDTGKCGARYEVSFSIDVAPGQYQVTIYHRSDGQTGVAEMTQAAQSTVIVQ